MNIYTGINIGPVVDTLSLAKRPRELWSASYLFSYLMQLITDEIRDNKEVKIISPALLSSEDDSTVGLYPDRVFVEGRINAEEIVEKALNKFAEKIDIEINLVKKYFNVMSISIEESLESSAIQNLNCYLDFAELDNRAIDEEVRTSLLKLIQKKYKSPLFDLAFIGKRFSIPSLAELATRSLSIDSRWNEISKRAKLEEKVNADIPEKYRVPDEDFFYKEIKETFNNEFKSYHKYFCIVQADGDNMGKVVSHPDNSSVNDLSKGLLKFGTAACKSIREFGGLPIYAGGDDLLFIAPVVSTDNKNIFNLLSTIDNHYKEVQKIVEKLKLTYDQGIVATSMSYGLSITYYKYPLYEALSSAHNLLFRKAKRLDEKNAIAWNFQKHSGSSFCAYLSKSQLLFSLFEQVIETTVNEKIVSAVAHKIRSNSALLSLLIDQNNNLIRKRLDAFFDKIIDLGDKSSSNIIYLDSVKELLFNFYQILKMEIVKKQDGTPEDNIEIVRKRKTDRLILNIYGMLRIAKFVKGEGDEDE